jgi:hypothetical protein
MLASRLDTPENPGANRFYNLPSCSGTPPPRQPLNEGHELPFGQYGSLAAASDVVLRN